MKLLIVLALVSSAAVAQTSDNPDRISILGGYGPDGLEIGGNAPNQDIHPFMGPLIGLEYSHLMHDQFSISVMALHGTSTASQTTIGAIGVGYNFCAFCK